MNGRVAFWGTLGCLVVVTLTLYSAWDSRTGTNPLDHSPEAWPPDELTLITHSSAGGGGDVMARELARTLERMFDITVTIENRVGGSGAVATAYIVTRAPRDGSVLQIITPTQLITPVNARGIPTFRDVTTVVLLLLDPTMIYVREGSPFDDINDMLTYARENPNALTWGIGSAGSVDRLIVEEVQEVVGIRVRMVPHEGGGDAMISVLGGHIDAGLGEPGQFVPQLESGDLRMLTIFDDERLEDFPDVATFEELGFSIANHKFRGVWGPPDMSPQLVERIATVLAQAIEEEPFRTYYRAGNMRPRVLVGEEFRKYLERMDGNIRSFMAGSG